MKHGSMKLRNIFLILSFVGILVAGTASVLLYANPARALVYGGGPGDSTSVGSPTASSLYVTWTTSYAGVTSQAVYRNSSYIATVGSGSGYTDSGLSCGTTYSYYVCTNYGCSTSGSGTTIVCPPAAPTGFSAVPASQSQINLSWTASAGASAYYVYRNGAFIANTSATSFSDTGLSCNGGGSYYVVAYNAGGSSGASNSASASTDQCTPGTPTIGSATCVDQTTATVTWTRGFPYTESGFNIYSSGGPYRGSAGALATSGTASGLTASTPYAFNVEAYVTTNGRSYYSARSANSNVCTTLPNPPATPTGFSASGVSSSQIVMSWTAVSGATSYTVNRYPGGGLVYSGSGTSASDTGLLCNTSFTYTVYASNSGGNSATASASASTVVCAPAAPTGLSASGVSGSQVNLSWTASVGATGYYVYRNSVYVGSTGTTSYSDTGLTCGTSYSYYVVAYNAGGNSPSSVVVSGTTSACPPPPTIPAGVLGSPVSQTQINLSWNSSTAYVGTRLGYNVYRNSVYIGWTEEPSHAYSDTGLSCGTTYSYQIDAYDNRADLVPPVAGVNRSAQSTAINVTTSACDTTPPSFSITGSNSAWTTSASVTATASDLSGISYVRHCWADTGVVPPCDPGTTAASTFTNGVVLTQTTSGSSWYVCFRAMDTVGNWTPALTSVNYASYCWGPVRVDTTAPTPNPPTVTASTASQTSLSVSVSLGTDGHSGLATSPYEFSTNGSTYTPYASNSQIISSLTCGTAYTVYGKIKDAVGNMTNVGTASASTNSCVSVPPAVSSFSTLHETSGGGGLTASWSSVGSTGYRVYVKGGRTNPSNAVLIGDISTTNVLAPISGQCPSSYTITVVAYNTDPSISGTDSSCTTAFGGSSLSNATVPSGVKCSTPTTATVQLKSCTSGFLLE